MLLSSVLLGSALGSQLSVFSACVDSPPGMPARKTISWCHVLFTQSSRYSPDFTAVKVEAALGAGEIRRRNVFGWLVFVEEVLKIGRSSCAEVIQFFWSTGKGFKERRLACFTYTFPSSSLTSCTCCCKKWTHRMKRRECWKKQTT